MIRAVEAVPLHWLHVGHDGTRPIHGRGEFAETFSRFRCCIS